MTGVLTHYHSVVHRFNHYTTRTPPSINIVFVGTQLNVKTVLFQTIQFSLSHLFAPCLNVKWFYLIHRQDPIRYYYSGPEWTWERWHWRSTPHSLKLHHCSVSYSGHSLGGWSLIPQQRCSWCILQPKPTELFFFFFFFNWKEKKLNFQYFNHFTFFFIT